MQLGTIAFEVAKLVTLENHFESVPLRTLLADKKSVIKIRQIVSIKTEHFGRLQVQQPQQTPRGQIFGRTSNAVHTIVYGPGINDQSVI